MNWLVASLAVLFVWSGINTALIVRGDGGQKQLPPLAERINKACGPKGHVYDWSSYSPGYIDPLPVGTVQVTCDTNDPKKYKRWYVAVATG